MSNKNSPAFRKSAKRVSRGKGWSLAGDQFANLKAWREQFTLEEMVALAEQADVSIFPMRRQTSTRKRRSAA